MNLCLAEYRWAYLEAGMCVRVSAHICNFLLWLLTKPGGSGTLAAASIPRSPILFSNTRLLRKELGFLEKGVHSVTMAESIHGDHGTSYSVRNTGTHLYEEVLS